MIKHTRKDPTILVDDIFVALKAQTVTEPGTDTAEVVIPQLTANIKALKEQRDTIAQQMEIVLDDFPLSEILDRACPGSAVLTAAQILLAIGDGSEFDSAGHLSAYAEIAPVTRRSGSSIRGGFPARSRNKRLKTPCFTQHSLPSAATSYLAIITNASEQKESATMRL